MKTRITSASKLSLLAGLVLAVAGYTSEPNAPPLIKAAGTNAATANVMAPTALKTNAAEMAEAPVQKVAPQRVALPPGADQVADLAQAGLGEPVLLEFVRNSPNAYDLNVDEIVYLTDLGIPESVLAAMLRHGKELQEQTAPATVAEAAPQGGPGAAPAPAQAQEAQPGTGAPAAPVAATEAPAPQAPAPATEYVYTPPPAEVSYNYFYDTLSPYGAWMDLPDYGWCWQPTCAVIDPFWRPYWQRGHWAYTDCGWYWGSDYSWGWAPFHYGRWHHHDRHGWLWQPGYVWGPAWVSWRHWDTYCGWAPLPPGAGWDAHLGLTYRGAAVGVGFGFGLGSDLYSFVHYRYLGHPRVWQYPLSRREAAKVYNNSTVVNNIVMGNKHTIVNGGIAPERVKAVTRREVPKLALRDISPGPDSAQKPDRYDRNTKQLAVYRPNPPANGLVPPSTTIAPAYQPARRLQEARKDTLGSPVPQSRLGASSGVRWLAPAPVVPPGRSTSATRVQAPIPSRLTEEGRLVAPAPTSPARLTPPSASPQPAPNRAGGPVTVLPPSSTRSPASPTPTREVSPRAPAYQSAPASQPRYSAPAPAAPAQRQPSSQPEAPSRRRQDSYAPPPAGSRPAAEFTRSEPRKIEPVTPNYTPPPKYASAPAAAPSYGPVPAASMPRPAPAAPYFAPAPSAPARPTFSPPASSAPSYVAPSRVSSSAPMSQPSSAAPSPASPSGGSERGGSGSRGGGRSRSN